MKILIEKALYSLHTLERQFWLLLSDKLHGIDLKPSRYDTDVWMKPANIEYNFIATYVDNFIIIANDSVVCTNEFSKFFLSKVKAYLIIS